MDLVHISEEQLRDYVEHRIGIVSKKMLEIEIKEELGMLKTIRESFYDSHCQFCVMYPREHANKPTRKLCYTDCDINDICEEYVRLRDRLLTIIHSAIYALEIELELENEKNKERIEP